MCVCLCLCVLVCVCVCVCVCLCVCVYDCKCVNNVYVYCVLTHLFVLSISTDCLACQCLPQQPTPRCCTTPPHPTSWMRSVQTIQYTYCNVCLSSSTSYVFPVSFLGFTIFGEIFTYWGFLTRVVYLYNYIEDSGPERCVSSMLCSRDTPFWSQTLDI